MTFDFKNGNVSKSIDNSQTGNSRVTVIARDTPSSIGGHVYAIIHLVQKETHLVFKSGIFAFIYKINIV